MKLTHLSEEELIQRLLVKDKPAVDYLYRQYSGALFGVILRIVREKEIAEEVFHDAFVKICSKIEKYDRSKGKLYTWMVNLCRNSAIDRTRTREFSQRSKTDQIEDFVYENINLSAEDTASDHIGLDKLINELDENQRFVLKQIYFEGFTHSEVAEEFDIPLGTVKTRLRSALQKLRKKLS